MISPEHLARRSAVGGGVVWIVLLFLPTSDSHETDLINKVLLFGVFVVVPLGLSLIATHDRHGRQPLCYRLAVVAQPIGAVITVASLLVHQGSAAASLAGVWLAIDILIAAFGVIRFLPRGLHPVEEFCIDAGLFYLPVAGF